ncbi:MAG: extracellular solute-binding protein [Ruminococcus sp.]|jgi:ABC-type glycerol-3-phosphate transport system substrate-binding protein|nr:extracellular solute-binding protein [Ruminococcus sp.]
MKQKKFNVIVLTLILIIGIFGGCNEPAPTENKPSEIYKSTAISSANEDYTYITGAAFENDILTLLTSNPSLEVPETAEYSIVKMNTDGEILEKFPLGNSATDSPYTITHYIELKESNGNYYSIKSVGQIDGEKVTGGIFLARFDGNFNETAVLDISSLLEREGYDKASAWVDRFVVFDEIFCFAVGNGFYAYDLNRETFVMKPDFGVNNGVITDIFIDSKERITIMRSRDLMDFTLTYADLKTASLSEPEPAPAVDFIALNTDSDFEFLYSSSSVISGFKDGESVEIADLSQSGLFGVTERYCVALANNEFIIIGENSSGYGGVYKAKLTDPTDMSEKIKITISGINNTLSESILRFNETNPLYFVEFKQYDFSEIDTALSLDIISGKAGDMLLISGMIDFNTYASKGVFEDLLPYFEADSSISIDDCVDSVINAAKMGDKLFSIAKSFQVGALAGRKSILGNASGKTFTELNEIARNSNLELFVNIRRDIFIDEFVGFSLGSFVDYNTGVSNFESQDFINILEYAKGLPVVSPFDDPNVLGQRTADAYQAGEGLLYNFQLDNFRAKLSLETMYFKEPAVFIGYPTSNGSSGITAWLYDETAILSTSDKKEGAWAFTKFLLSESKIPQGTQTYNATFSVLKSRLEFLAENSLKKFYIDENGDRVDNILTVNYPSTDIETKLPDLTEADIQEVMETIDKIGGIHRLDLNLRKIVLEEADAFFGGKNTAKEAAVLIQNRVTTYLEENR